jgi:hypothetical protein
MDTQKFRITPETRVSDIDLDSEVFTLPDGTRLTEEKAEQLADATERRLAGLVPGRKSLSGGKVHSPVLQLRVPVALRDKLEQIAADRGENVSKVARDLLTESVDKLTA